VILPNSGGKIILPFDATNLNAVDVAIIKIYENNIPQFLQSNKLDGDQDLRRVAKPLVQATIRLDNDKSLNLHKRNRFSLDLDKYIKTEPGAIYRVNIGFRPEYSLYTCNEAKQVKKKREIMKKKKVIAIIMIMNSLMMTMHSGADMTLIIPMVITGNKEIIPVQNLTSIKKDLITEILSPLISA